MLPEPLSHRAFLIPLSQRHRDFATERAYAIQDALRAESSGGGNGRSGGSSAPRSTAASRALAGLMAYFGTYSVEPARSIVIHHVEGDPWGLFDGKDEERPFELSEYRLTLSLDWSMAASSGWASACSSERGVSGGPR